MNALIPYSATRSELEMKNVGDSRLTSKFQVTVPKNVRKLMQLHTGDLLVFVLRKHEIVLKRGEIRIAAD
jgi:AbrB family looped-hinge helix DNA binding protein